MIEERTYIYLRTFVELKKVNQDVISRIILSSGYNSYDCIKNKSYPLIYLNGFL